MASFILIITKAMPTDFCFANGKGCFDILKVISYYYSLKTHVGKNKRSSISTNYRHVLENITEQKLEKNMINSIENFIENVRYLQTINLFSTINVKTKFLLQNLFKLAPKVFINKWRDSLTDQQFSFLNKTYVVSQVENLCSESFTILRPGVYPCIKKSFFMLGLFIIT